MGNDIEEKVLEALKKEAKENKVADYFNVTPESLSITTDQFYGALKSMEEKGIIDGLVWNFDGTCLYDGINIFAK